MSEEIVQPKAVDQSTNPIEEYKDQQKKAESKFKKAAKPNPEPLPTAVIAGVEVELAPAEILEVPASAYRHADPFHHDCPGCGFDLALPAFKTKAGLQVVECCRCNTVFCPDAQSKQVALRSSLADQFAKLKAGEPHLIELP